MLVGRQAEREHLQRLLEMARRGTSGVLVLEGEPGVGKSVLLEEAARLADGFTVLRASGTESEEEVAFAALLSLCRPLVPLLHHPPAEQERALAAALGISAASGTERFLVGAGYLGLLAAASQRQPLLVLVDDFHWVDPPSAQALVFAARRLEADAVAVILAARTGEARPPASTRCGGSSSSAWNTPLQEPSSPVSPRTPWTASPIGCTPPPEATPSLSWSCSRG